MWKRLNVLAIPSLRIEKGSMKKYKKITKFPIGAFATILTPTSEEDDTRYTIINLEKNYVRLSYPLRWSPGRTHSSMWIAKNRVIRVRKNPRSVFNKLTQIQNSEIK